MKSGALVLVATLIGFGAGYAASHWSSQHPAIPAPPATALTEVRAAVQHGPTPAPGEASAEALSQLKEDIEAFRQKWAPFKAEFHAKIDEILTPEQRELLANRRKANQGTPPPNGPARPKIGDPNWAPTGIIFITASVDRMAEEVHLTTEQKEAIRALFIAHRARFLAFTDETPPPSLRIPTLVPAPTPTP